MKFLILASTLAISYAMYMAPANYTNGGMAGNSPGINFNIPIYGSIAPNSQGITWPKIDERIRKIFNEMQGPPVMPAYKAYRSTLPDYLCSANSIANTNSVNYNANTQRHNDVRTSIFNCEYDVVKPKQAFKTVNWNTDIATHAQTWADHLKNNNNCGMQHEGSRTYSVDGQNVKLGENLAWFSYCVNENNLAAKQSEVCGKALYENSTQNWFDEVTDWINRNNGQFMNLATHQGSPAVGHYTQVVHDESDEIGTGIAQCEGGAEQNGGNTCSWTPSTGWVCTPIMMRCYSFVVVTKYKEQGNVFPASRTVKTRSGSSGGAGVYKMYNTYGDNRVCNA